MQDAGGLLTVRRLVGYPQEPVIWSYLPKPDKSNLYIHSLLSQSVLIFHNVLLRLLGELFLPGSLINIMHALGERGSKPEGRGFETL
jgi:hypothetical protein